MIKRKGRNTLLTLDGLITVVKDGRLFLPMVITERPAGLQALFMLLSYNYLQSLLLTKKILLSHGRPSAFALLPSNKHQWGFWNIGELLLDIFFLRCMAPLGGAWKILQTGTDYMKNLANVWTLHARAPSASYPFVHPSLWTIDDLTKKTNKLQERSGSSCLFRSSQGMGLRRFSFSSTEAGCFSLCRGGGQREAAARYGSSGGWFPCEVSCKRRGRGSSLCPEVTSASLRPRVVVVAAAAHAEPEGDRAFVTGDVDKGAMTDSNPAHFMPQEQRLWPADGAPAACPGWAWHCRRWGFCPRVSFLGGITSLVKRKK